jgi:glycerophosphoryl diester phosphodiesterase
MNAFPADIPRRPIVIAHRGASGYLPEHTLAAYFVAMQMGADFIEPDLVMTRDGALVARHENEISQTTDVARHARFADRRTRKVIDGVPTEGWFTEDFTLSELKQLRAVERLPALRSGNTRFDGMFEIPTFDEILTMVHGLQPAGGAAVGVYPETKHPSHFAGIGLPMEELLVRTLERFGYRGRAAPVFIQSFETGNLRALRSRTDLPLVQLVEDRGQPFDLQVRGDPRSYADIVTAAGLAEVAQYADAVGVHKHLVCAPLADGRLAAPSALVADAHAVGVRVHVWTLRGENAFLPPALRHGSDESARGDLAAETQTYLSAGVDGFFTDHPDVGVQVRNRFAGTAYG